MPLPVLPFCFPSGSVIEAMDAKRCLPSRLKTRPRKYVWRALLPSRSSGQSVSSSDSRLRTDRDCFSPDVYEPKPLWSRTANRPSGESATAVGRLLIGRGFPGTSVSNLPFGSWVLRGASCATREHAKKGSNTKESLEKRPERFFMV